MQPLCFIKQETKLYLHRNRQPAVRPHAGYIMLFKMPTCRIHCQTVSFCDAGTTDHTDVIFGLRRGDTKPLIAHYVYMQQEKVELLPQTEKKWTFEISSATQFILDPVSQSLN